MRRGSRGAERDPGRRNDDTYLDKCPPVARSESEWSEIMSGGPRKVVLLVTLCLCAALTSSFANAATLRMVVQAHPDAGGPTRATGEEEGRELRRIDRVALGEDQ